MPTVFGLRWRRLFEWRRVLKAELRVMTAGSLIAMLKLAINPGRWVDRRTAIRRYWRCWRCPVFDRNLRRCRPYNGSPIGCGCYAPYAIVTGKKCWLRESGLGVEGHGYD